jgi:hypothetical protein
MKVKTVAWARASGKQDACGLGSRRQPTSTSTIDDSRAAKHPLRRALSAIRNPKSAFRILGVIIVPPTRRLKRGVPTETPPPYFPQNTLSPGDEKTARRVRLAFYGCVLLALAALVGLVVGVVHLVRSYW